MYLNIILQMLNVGYSKKNILTTSYVLKYNPANVVVTSFDVHSYWVIVQVSDPAAQVPLHHWKPLDL